MNKKLSDTPLWAIYMLHLDQPIRGKRHYVGRCAADRLQQRMLEHTTGTGAKLTADACKAGIGWSLARVTHAIRPDHEQVLASVAEQPGICPVCQNVLPISRFTPTKNAASKADGVECRRPNRFEAVASLAPSANEKGRKPVATRPLPSSSGDL